MSLYFDASAILPLLVAESASEAVQRFVVEAGEPLIVSEFAAAEVACGLSRRARTGAVTDTAAMDGLSRFDAWRAAFTTDIDIQASDVRLAHLIVRRFDLALRAPDALHAAVCRRADLTLVTLDRRLLAAAEALGIGVEQPA